MYILVRRYGETSWTSTLLPVSVDGMIAASSMTLLADSRNGQRSGLLPWTLLVIGSAASLAANVAVAEPSAVGRLIAAWPSSALIGSYELLMRRSDETQTRSARVIPGERIVHDRAVRRRRCNMTHGGGRSPTARRPETFRPPKQSLNASGAGNAGAALSNKPEQPAV
jgi:hypothetical protein